MKSPTNLSLLTLFGSMLLVPPYHFAQAQGDAALEEIVVTARKREENLQDIPISINAYSAEDILEADLAGLEDISQLASGFYFFNQGQTQPGRYNTQLRFRGLNQAQFSPSFEAGALFVDGVYVLNGGTSLSLMDIERVEVIKGPQSAYFGRNTFGGAVNFITRDPSMEGFQGQANISLGSRESIDFNVLIEGPLIPETLSASLSARYYDKTGHYRASDGGRLGNEQTTAVNGKLLWQVNDNFTLRMRASYSEDDDGAPAQAYVAGRLNDTCLGNEITNPAGETANPFNYICGAVPGPDEAIPAQNSRIIDGNTFFPPNVQPFYENQVLPGLAPARSDIGLSRETLRLSLSGTYDLGDYTLDFIGGFNEQGANFNRDFDLTAFPGGFSGDPQSLEDRSFELRITSPQEGRLRWLAGVNYYEQEFTSSLQGGTFIFGCLSSDQGGSLPPPAGTGTFDAACVDADGDGLLNLVGPFNNTFRESDEAEVLGVFAAVDYDVTDQITLTLEGRLQYDTVTKGGITDRTGLGQGAREIEFDEFLPRAIVRYQPRENTTLYASYALGVIPGELNTEFINADDQERAQILNQFPGLGETLPQEELDAFEIGLKQTLFNNRAYLNAAIYWNEWTGIKGRSSALINETCTQNDVAIGAVGCAYAGVVPDVSTRMIDDGMGNLILFFNSRNILLDGDADLFGFELEAGGNITENWTVDLGIAYVDTEYTRYQFNFGAARFGTTDQTGNAVPRVPDWSANLTSTYRFSVTDRVDGFVRGDVTYFGEAFTDERNFAFIDDYTLVNLRAGVETAKYRLELFARNLFDEDGWASGARFSDTSFPVDFANFFVEQGVNLSPQDRQEFGIRGTVRF